MWLVKTMLPTAAMQCLRTLENINIGNKDVQIGDSFEYINIKTKTSICNKEW